MLTVDSNHWIYYLDDATPEHGRVAPAMDRLLDAQELLQPAIVQMEVAHYAVWRWRHQAAAPMGVFLGLPAREAPLTSAGVQAGTDLLLRFPGRGIGGRDAALLATMMEHRAKVLLTGDRALSRVAAELGFEVRNLAAR